MSPSLGVSILIVTSDAQLSDLEMSLMASLEISVLNVVSDLSVDFGSQVLLRHVTFQLLFGYYNVVICH